MGIILRLTSFLIVTWAVLLASGCATASRRALAPENQTKLTDVQGMIVSSQQELAAEIEQSNVAMYSGGGLIPALIDAGINSSRAKKATSLIAEIRTSAGDYDLVGDLKKRLVEKFPVGNAGAIVIDEVGVEPFTGLVDIARHANKTDGKAVVVFRPYYALSADFSVMKLTIHVSLHGSAPRFAPHAKSGPSLPRENVLYANVFYVSAPIPDYNGERDREDYAAAWAIGGGTRIQTVFVEAVGEFLEMLAYDLTRPAPENYKPYPLKPRSAVKAVPGWDYAVGVTEQTRQGRVWLRGEDGSLFSVL